MKKPRTPELLHDQYYEKEDGNLEHLYELPRTKIALRWVKGIKPQKLLDLGCGPGHLARLIKKVLPRTEIHGVDFSNTAIKKAIKVLDRCWKINLDLEGIPIESNQYDAIICTEVIEHIYDISHVLKEVNRLLRPGGKVLMSVPNLAYWRYRLQLLTGIMPHPEVFSSEHIHAFTLCSLQKRLLEANLEVDHCWGYGRRLHPLSEWFPTLFSSTLFVESSMLEK
jgi:2-polyprenyl-3-methyl-5-hydroxy-6-metoxy-1,4-benzoquinol methylase